MNTSNYVKKLYSENSEKYVIGCLFLDIEKTWDQITSEIGIQDFFNPVHAIIFTVISEFVKNEKIPDIVAVCDKLKKIDDSPFIEIITDCVASVSSILTCSEHAKRVKAFSRLRKAEGAANRFLKNLDDGDEAIYQLEKDVSKLSEEATVTVTSSETYVDKFFEENKNPKKFIKTGFSVLDSKIQGFEPGEVVVLAARSGVGKTAIALNFAMNMCNQGHSVGFISMEMTMRAIFTRIFANQTGISQYKFQLSNFTLEELAKINAAKSKVAAWKFHITDSTDVELMKLIGVIRGMKFKSKVEIVFIDYLQLIRNQKESIREQILEATRMLKTLAMQLGIVIIEIAQLSRGADQSDEPEMHHLQESSSIEKDANKVLLLHKKKTNDQYDMRLKVAKNREGSSGMIIPLQYQGFICNFIEKKE